MYFQDRTDAGRFLAGKLERFAGESPVILGLPRGGVPVAFEVAKSLGAPLDVIVARKLGAPEQPEFGFGAICGNAVVIDPDSVDMLGLEEDEIEQIIAAQRDEATRRESLFRAGRPPIDVAGRVVIVVDDGLATGVTARAACKAIRERNPARIVFASPVCASSSAEGLKEYADEVICGYIPPYFAAVGQWYAVFDQTSDHEVLDLLARAHGGGPGPVPLETFDELVKHDERFGDEGRP